jgi:hypothetical protein
MASYEAQATMATRRPRKTEVEAAAAGPLNMDAPAPRRVSRSNVDTSLYALAAFFVYSAYLQVAMRAWRECHDWAAVRRSTIPTRCCGEPSTWCVGLPVHRGLISDHAGRGRHQRAGRHARAAKCCSHALRCWLRRLRRCGCVARAIAPSASRAIDGSAVTRPGAGVVYRETNWSNVDSGGFPRCTLSCSCARLPVPLPPHPRPSA